MKVNLIDSYLQMDLLHQSVVCSIEGKEIVWQMEGKPFYSGLEDIDSKSSVRSIVFRLIIFHFHILFEYGSYRYTNSQWFCTCWQSPSSRSIPRSSWPKHLSQFLHRRAVNSIFIYTLRETQPI